MADGKEAKSAEGGQFSADTQNMNEPVQEGSVLRRRREHSGRPGSRFGRLSGLGAPRRLSPGRGDLDDPDVDAVRSVGGPRFLRSGRQGRRVALDQEAGIAGDDNLQSLLS